MESNREALPIERRQLGEFKQAADDRLKRVRWRPKVGAPSTPPAPGALQWRESTSAPASEASVSVLEVVQQLCGDAVLLSEDAHRVLSAIRLGLQIGSYL